MTSKAYIFPETKHTFRASGGDVVLTLTSLAAGAGRQAAQLDLGAGAQPFMYRWRFWMKFAAAPVVGEEIEIYLKTSDGTHADNDDGTADAAVSAEDKLNNLKKIGSLIVDEASATPEFSVSGQIPIFDRYVQPVFWNATATAFSSTAADHGFDLEEIPFQGQAT